MVAQSYKKVEVIIVDGLSKDDTVDIIKAYATTYAHIQFVSEKDNGIYDAMNKGIDLTTGEWLYFLGSDDDLFDSSVLQKVAEHIKEAPQYKVIYGNVQINGSSDWANHGQVYDGPFSVKKLLVKNIAHQAVFYHRSVFKEAGNYNVRYKVCGDHDFNLRLASQYKFHYINVTIAHFFAGGTSTFSNDVSFNEESRINIVQYFRKKLHLLPIKDFEFELMVLAKKNFKQKNIFEAFYFSSLVYRIRFKNLFTKAGTRSL